MLELLRGGGGDSDEDLSSLERCCLMDIVILKTLNCIKMREMDDVFLKCVLIGEIDDVLLVIVGMNTEARKKKVHSFVFCGTMELH